MFDIGFSELLLVMVIGLVVLGPERLPVAVRTVAGWIRALRSLASTVQNELSQELKLQELQDSLKKVEKAGLQNLSPELKSSMEELKEAAEAMKRSYGSSLQNDESGAEGAPYQPLNDPEALHDGVVDLEKAPIDAEPERNALSASDAPAAAVSAATPAARASSPVSAAPAPSAAGVSPASESPAPSVASVARVPSAPAASASSVSPDAPTPATKTDAPSGTATAGASSSYPSSGDR
ncbi:Sec-independent protein translocase subunit TatB [Affinibrenneria salicis]|uniref:Sec-independent protein translocase protein TatB n=1 Tax=Affinibrenneria salicis TaxID=2590031 RepID=A0A5J5FUR1_9GAMM|nr:Sec-independent protein translocase protein TatB [Affinibrenneria salicis]KAA8997269.1 Sec-independent protein translocase subunit TatB [Affinibrenneria salicis]